MKRNILAVCVTAATVFTLIGCRHTPPPFADAKEQPAGKEFYTAVNMWYEDPGAIMSTNYHEGAILPAGAKVLIRQVTYDSIYFEDVETSAEYRLVHVKRHSVLPMEEYFYRQFSEANPMGDNGTFEAFTDKEQENIKNGKIEKGMSREAVLMAYGYPPSHETPALETSTWIYWTNRWDTVEVKFEEERVNKVID